MTTNQIQNFALPAKIFTGDVVKAAYAAQEVVSFQGNPLVEALPPMLERQTVVDHLAYSLEYDETDRCLPDAHRMYLVQEIVNFFEPLPVHLDLERRFANMIRLGLTARNPLDRSYWQVLNQDEAQIQLTDSQSWQPHRKRTRSTGVGFGIIGDSGVGKTSAVEAILSLYPQVILHEQYQDKPFNFTQLVWLMLECPYDGSIKSLCLHFFELVDDLLNTNYYRVFARNGQASVEQMRPKIARVAGLHGIGVLVIDEIQQLSQAKSGGAAKMLNFFVGLVNVLGLPVVLVGTNEALSILGGTFRNARRLSGQGDFHWKRMANDGMWRYFVESLWGYQYTRTPTPLTQELLDALYFETQGVIDLAVKVYMLAQIRAITVAQASASTSAAQSETITVELLQSAAQDGLSFLQPLLRDMRSGKVNPQHLPYATIDIQHFVQAVMQMMLHAPSSAENSDTTLPELKQVREPHDVMSTTVKTDESIVAPPTVKPDLHQLPLIRAVNNDTEESAYTALAKAGYIRSATEFMVEATS